MDYKEALEYINGVSWQGTKPGLERISALLEKLGDLALVYGAYEAIAAQSGLDPMDRLTLLAERLPDSRYARGSDIAFGRSTQPTNMQVAVQTMGISTEMPAAPMMNQ